MTGDEPKTLGTKTSHVLETKDLGGPAEASPRAQELVRNNDGEKVKESVHNIGKANPGQRNSFMNFIFRSLPISF